METNLTPLSSQPVYILETSPISETNVDVLYYPLDNTIDLSQISFITALSS